MKVPTQHHDNLTAMGLLAIISMMTLMSTSSFQPPASNNKHIHHRSLDTNYISSNLVSRTSSKTTTTLHMVFDFFKKAQTEATEQMSAIANGLAKSRNQLLYNLEDSLASDSKNGMNLMDQLEDTLLQADLGMATTDDVLEEARYLRSESTEIFGRDEIKALLRGKLLEALGASAKGSSEYQRVQKRAGKEVVVDDDADDNSNSFALKFATEGDPKPISAKKQLTVHFIMGANGMGKTTTIGKLAHRLKAEAGQKVLLAACDTFRAGAVAQLERWAERADVDCFSPNEATNGPSAVLYGALDKAINEEYDVLLVDTSGRLSNNDALTAELVKMKKVIQKRMSTAFDERVRPVPNLLVPHETLLVIDAAQGRMALDSAKQWNKEVGLSGLILTKLDGSAKGGSVVAISRELGLPVKLVGVGEGINDLRDVSTKTDDSFLRLS
jgi:fused signal recognition particle receptor